MTIRFSGRALFYVLVGWSNVRGFWDGSYETPNFLRAVNFWNIWEGMGSPYRGFFRMQLLSW